MSWVKDNYREGSVWEEPQADGSVLYMVKMCVGGRDEDGEFGIVLDGPAQGEKYYG